MTTTTTTTMTTTMTATTTATIATRTGSSRAGQVYMGVDGDCRSSIVRRSVFYHPLWQLQDAMDFVTFLFGYQYQGFALFNCPSPGRVLTVAGEFYLFLVTIVKPSSST